MKDMLRAKYGLKPHIVGNSGLSSLAKELEWNELARLFVQRFQQIHGMPTDSLAGPRAFATLDATAVGGAVVKE